MVWQSLYRGYILTIFILILSNLIQKIKIQFVFFSRLLLLLILLLKRAALLLVEPPVLY